MGNGLADEIGYTVPSDLSFRGLPQKAEATSDAASSRQLRYWLAAFEVASPRLRSGLAMTDESEVVLKFPSPQPSPRRRGSSRSLAMPRNLGEPIRRVRPSRPRRDESRPYAEPA